MSAISSVLSQATGTSLNNLYGQRLKSKQALRTSYGKITERQFKNIIRKSEYGKATSNVNLRGLFERRLDVLVKRLGFAKTIFKSRQLVTHKFFKVNGRSVNSPSLILEVGDCISVADRVWDKVYFELSISLDNPEVANEASLPGESSPR